MVSLGKRTSGPISDQSSLHVSPVKFASQVLLGLDVRRVAGLPVPCLPLPCHPGHPFCAQPVAAEVAARGDGSLPLSIPPGPA